jgi:hypothetical protein
MSRGAREVSSCLILVLSVVQSRHWAASSNKGAVHVHKGNNILKQFDWKLVLLGVLVRACRVTRVASCVGCADWQFRPKARAQPPLGRQQYQRVGDHLGSLGTSEVSFVWTVRHAAAI